MRTGSRLTTQVPKKALLLERIHPVARDILSNAGWTIEQVDSAISSSELIARMSDVTALGIRSRTQITAEVLQNAPNLLAVGAFCIGTNQVDLDGAADHGVAVFNAPYSNSRSVVEMAVSQMIALTRRLPDLARAMRDGQWNKSASGAHEIRGRRLGIIGYGTIGTQLSVVAEALGMSVAFYDIEDRAAVGNARRCHSLHELLAESDIVTLYVDGREDNKCLIGSSELDTIKPGAILLNLSRGTVVDQEALYDALSGGHLAGAAVDVFPEEPFKSKDRFDCDLAKLNNVILTPHIGGSTEEAQKNIGEFVASKLVRFQDDGDSSTGVTLPHLSVPRRNSSTQRICHVHRDSPGNLANINATLARHGVNIASQWLATNGTLGYAVIDIPASGLPRKAMDDLEQIHGTIRCRSAGFSSANIGTPIHAVPENARELAHTSAMSA